MHLIVFLKVWAQGNSEILKNIYIIKPRFPKDVILIRMEEIELSKADSNQHYQAISINFLIGDAAAETFLRNST